MQELQLAQQKDANWRTVTIPAVCRQPVWPTMMARSLNGILPKFEVGFDDPREAIARIAKPSHHDEILRGAGN